MLYCRSSLLLCGMIAASVHELGHLLAILLTGGASVREVYLGIPGVKIKVSGCTMRPMIIVSGVLVNLLATLISAVLVLFCKKIFFVELAAANLCLAACNLLPAEPLDGGLLLRCLLEARMLPDKADKLMLIISIILLCPLTAAALYTAMRSRGNVSLLLLCLWLLTGILRNYV